METCQEIKTELPKQQTILYHISQKITPKVQICNI